MNEHDHGSSGNRPSGGQTGSGGAPAQGADDGMNQAQGQAQGSGGSDVTLNVAANNQARLNGTSGMDTLIGGVDTKTIRAGSGDDVVRAADKPAPVYVAEIQELNDSGVEGYVTASIHHGVLTTTVSLSGLEPNQTHVQHIHGRVGENGEPQNSTVPTEAQDADDDGFVELDEGLPNYGPILLNLTSDPAAGLAGFPTAPDGTVTFVQTYDLSETEAFAEGFDATDLTPLDLREFVVHGLTVEGGVGAGTPGEVDGSAGFKTVLPVGSGEFELAPGFGGTTELFGEDGDDVLIGGSGDDIMNGGRGNDTFVAGDGMDRIVQFDLRDSDEEVAGDADADWDTLSFDGMELSSVQDFADNFGGEGFEGDIRFDEATRTVEVTDTEGDTLSLEINNVESFNALRTALGDTEMM